MTKLFFYCLQMDHIINKLRHQFHETSGKLLYINKLSLPMDILFIIKSFSFSETNIIYIQLLMKEIINNINNSFYISDSYLHDSHWAFMIESQVYLQAINCLYCGNYIIAESEPPNYLYCQCRR